MSLLFARRAASPEIDDTDEWVFVHEETCGPISYKDALTSKAPPLFAGGVSSSEENSIDSREALAHLEDALNAGANENSRAPSGRGKKKHAKRR